MSAALRMTELQRLLVRTAEIHGTVDVAGRQMSREDLMACFSGQQVPKDPQVVQALGLHLHIEMDFSKLEDSVLSLVRDTGCIGQQDEDETVPKAPAEEGLHLDAASYDVMNYYCGTGFVTACQHDVFAPRAPANAFDINTDVVRKD
jgi:hypothetical protein